MKATSKENSSRWTKTNLVVFFVLVLLSVDEINPIKIFLHVFPAIKSWHVAMICTFAMIYIFISDLKNMTYFCLKIFFQSILSIFFRSVEIVGRENIPRHGPVLFTINHANQFMDAVMVICSCPHSVSYLMAEASYKRRVIGDFAWALGVVPVRRAQDDAKAGTGKIQLQPPAVVPNELIDAIDTGIGRIVAEDQGNSILENTTSPPCSESNETSVTKREIEEAALVETKLITVSGYDTRFTQELVAGDKICLPGTAAGLKVKSIESDTTMVVDGTDLPADFPQNLFEPNNIVPFDVLKHTPLNKVFEKVLDRLAAAGAVGIFPEGGSHDRTDLLPLKVGISLIAYSALEQDGINVPVVPVGLNYFRAHRWRGRAVIEYGRPIFIDPSTLPDYIAGGNRRHKVCNEFLERVEDSMRSVIVSAPDYETLELIHTARRLYQRKTMDVSEKQDLSRRFVEGYKRLLQVHDGKELPQEWQELQSRIHAYRNELKELGLKDYQVPSLTEERLDEMDVTTVDTDKFLSGLQVLYHVLHFSTLLCISAVPVLLLNLPVGVMAGIYSEKRRKKALANSKVKIRGFDVMLTEKVLFCIVMVPTLWLFYGVLLICFTSVDGPTIALIMGCMPLFAYTGIIVADAGMVEIQDLRPYVMRIFPSTRRQLAALPQKRKQLKDDLRRIIKTLGPTLGDVYFGKNVEWQPMKRIDSKESATQMIDVEVKKMK